MSLLDLLLDHYWVEYIVSHILYIFVLQAGSSNSHPCRICVVIRQPETQDSRVLSPTYHYNYRDILYCLPRLIISQFSYILKIYVRILQKGVVISIFPHNTNEYVHYLFTNGFKYYFKERRTFIFIRCSSFGY